MTLLEQFKYWVDLTRQFPRAHPERVYLRPIFISLIINYGSAYRLLYKERLIIKYLVLLAIRGTRELYEHDIPANLA